MKIFRLRNKKTKEFIRLNNNRKDHWSVIGRVKGAFSLHNCGLWKDKLKVEDYEIVEFNLVETEIHEVI